MREIRKIGRLLVVLFALTLISAVLAPALAAEGEAAAAPMKLEYFGAAVGAGMVVIGAGFGIGKFAAAAADGVARQPQAATQITGAVQLPLFLLEGLAIIAVVTCLLIVLLK
jgi:F-type H+-transporting ATPase subunit c